MRLRSAILLARCWSRRCLRRRSTTVRSPNRRCCTTRRRRRRKPLFAIARGTPVEVVVALDAWVKVRDAKGDLAWIEKRLLSEKRTVMVKADRAQVRVQPDDNAASRSSRPRRTSCSNSSSPARPAGPRCGIATASRASSRPPGLGTSDPMKIAVLGAGAWGTALALAFSPRHAMSPVDLAGRACRGDDAARENAAVPARLPAARQLDGQRRSPARSWTAPIWRSSPRRWPACA